MKRFQVVFSILLCLHTSVFSQNNRINTQNQIGWFNYFGTLKIQQKFSAHTEYQWRRSDIIQVWQQSLLRLGVNYHYNPRVLFRVGYGWIETFAYGDIPLNALGRDFTEHRLFQMVQLSQKEGKLDISHRFMLEQRWVGTYSSEVVQQEDRFPLLNRIRYMARVQVPLNIGFSQTPYLAIYDEIFIGFGKNVNANVFDQNRLGILFGYPLNKKLRLEAGFINQIVQYGRQIGGKNVFQTNNGVILNVNLSI